METFEEKVFFLKQLIELAKIDGILHDKEIDFLSLIAEDFGIDKTTYYKLYTDEIEKVQVNFTDRIIQLYRLILVMQCDGNWHEKEVNKINEIGLLMGLDPNGIAILLAKVKADGTKDITPEFMIKTFFNQLN